MQKQVPRTRADRPSYFIGSLLLGLVILSICAIASLLIIAYRELENSPQQVTLLQPPTAVFEPYTLTPYQQGIIQQNGAPQSFSILFYTLNDETGAAVDVRDETWYYYSRGKVYTFINGSPAGQTDLGNNPPTAQPVLYSPEQFNSGMGLEQVAASARLERYLQVPLEDELVPGSRLYYANMLAFALQNGKLRYVETLALEEEAQP